MNNLEDKKDTEVKDDAPYVSQFAKSGIKQIIVGHVINNIH